jgi:chemotaxis protein CheZ
MRHERIPEAGRELDAIVEATEEATNTIMTAAEDIMAADPSDPDAYQAVVNDQIVRIFEACSFQDITGQRISKVVSTLSHLDDRINTLIERLKLMKIEPDQGTRRDVESEAERRRRELILHGPQHKGEGVSQDDVDALLR